jgi:hypothetical protein
MSGLRKALEQVIPKECFLAGLKIKEKQRVFSIKPGQGEAALGIKIDHKAMEWQPDQPRCDALFICSTPEDALVVAFVELKGSDVEHALTQIVESTRSLCKRSSPVRDIHVQPVLSAVETLEKKGHKASVLGIVVSRKGLQLDQKRRKKIWKDPGIVIKIQTGKLSEKTCKQLADWLPRGKRD